VNPRVSVVVPTYRRPELLERCLGALVAQDLEPRGFEVIVADDAASSETREQVERWASLARDGLGPVIRYLTSGDRQGPAAARNAGWRSARGAVIAFTDDDCLPEPNWLATGLAAIDAGADGVSGRLVLPLDRTPTDYERNAALLGEARFVTANCFYRRSALERLDGFDERYTMAWREDSDLAFRLEEIGGRLARVPDAIVVHPIRPAGWGVSLRQQRKSQFNALLYKRHPARYRAEIQPAPPWDYYRTVASLFVALAGLALGRRTVAAGGLIAWLLLTGRFCARRLAGTSRAPTHVVEMVATSALIPPLSIFWRLRGAARYRVWFL
jgi:GT2 family glycosyltransferase